MNRALLLCIPLTLLLWPQTALPPDWKVLFRDNFEDGDAEGWAMTLHEDAARGWLVEKEGSNHVFAGRGHSKATVIEGRWADFRFAAKVKILEGSINLDFRESLFAAYFVTFEPNRLWLSRSRSNMAHVLLANVAEPYTPGRWYTLEVVGLGANIKVCVDGVLKIDVTDPEPHLAGGAALEALSGSYVQVDDVEVSGPPSAPGPTWLKTGGPLGGVGYDVRMRPDNPDLMFVTDTFTGVNMSLDGGKTWYASNRGITARVGLSGDAIPVFCLTIDPHNPNVIWIGTQGTRGIFKSVDGGKTWVEKDKGVTEPAEATFRGLTIDPRTSDIVYAAAEIPASKGSAEMGKQFRFVTGAVYRTLDGGENWSCIWRGDNLARYVWINPRNRDVIYVSTGIHDREARNSDPQRDFAGGVGVLKSVDGGRTWQTLNEANGLKNLYVGSLFMHPQNPDMLLASASNFPYPKGGGVYLTTNGGARWELTLVGVPVSGEIFDAFTSVEYAASDPRIAYAAAGRNFYRSEDGGRTWQAMSGDTTPRTYGPAGVRIQQVIDIQVDPRNPDRVFLNGYAGGNFLSEDGGRTWKVASKGYTGAQVFDLAVDPRDWRRVYAIGGVPFRSDDGGETWEGLHSPPLMVDPWQSVALDPRNPDRVLLTEENRGQLFHSTDDGRRWELLFTHPDVRLTSDMYTHNGIRPLVFAPSNPDVLYAGMRRTKLILGPGCPGKSFGVLKSTDGGRTFRNANDANTAEQDVNALAVDPRSEEVVYAGTLMGGILQTRDGGRSWRPLNRGLRILDVRALAVDPNNPSVLYAGIENGGLYRTLDGGANWSVSSYGMDPQAIIRDLVIDPTNPQVLYAADLRTGVYRSEDGGKSWVLINRGLRIRAVNALAISSDGSTLYAGTDGEGVFRLDIKPRAEVAVSAVSAASFARDAPLAPESIGSLFGAGLATGPQQATAVPLPVLLADASVSVTDSAGVDRWAPLFFVSPGQINCQIPAGTATGTATVRVLRQNRVVARGQVRIEPVAPALFTANADGKGAPAAVALRVAADGSQTQVPVFQCAATCTPAAIDLGVESDQVILLLFGTGIRGGKDMSVRIGGLDAPVLGASAQGQFVGLDQVNVRLPRALAGRGEVDLLLTVDGKASNVVKVRIQ